MPHYYTVERLEDMQKKLLEIQRKKKVFVTVREAVAVLGGSTSTSAARYKLDALVEQGLAEKIRNHYHVKEPTESNEKAGTGTEGAAVLHD